MKNKEHIYSTSNPRRCKAVAFKFHILYLKKTIYLKVIIYILEKIAYFHGTIPYLHAIHADIFLFILKVFLFPTQ